MICMYFKDHNFKKWVQQKISYQCFMIFFTTPQNKQIKVKIAMLLNLPWWYLTHKVGLMYSQLLVYHVPPVIKAQFSFSVCTMEALLKEELQNHNGRNFMQLTTFTHTCVPREFIIEMNWKKYKSFASFKP